MIGMLIKNLILPAVFIIIVMFVVSLIRKKEFVVDNESSFKIIAFVIIYNTIRNFINNIK